MTAGAELQAAIVAASSNLPELNGVFDGPPARAQFPYLVVDCGAEKDWTSGARQGREVMAVLTLWDDQSARLLKLEEALQQCRIGDRSLPTWELSSLLPESKKKVRSVEGPWASHLTLRARLLKVNRGGELAEA